MPMTNDTRGRNESSVLTGDIFPRVTRLMIRLYAVARTHASRHFFSKGPQQQKALLGNVGLSEQRCLYSPQPFYPGVKHCDWEAMKRNCPGFLLGNCYWKGWRWREWRRWRRWSLRPENCTKIKIILRWRILLRSRNVGGMRKLRGCYFNRCNQAALLSYAGDSKSEYKCDTRYKFYHLDKVN